MKAAAAGLDPFDGYMAGLLHSAGWTAALRQLDRCGSVVQPWTSVFARELAARRDPLFGKVVGAWRVSSAITALAEAARGPGLAVGHSTLARLLRRIIQATKRIGSFIVRRGRNNAVMRSQHGIHGFNPACGAQQVSRHRLG